MTADPDWHGLVGIGVVAYDVRGGFVAATSSLAMIESDDSQVEERLRFGTFD